MGYSKKNIDKSNRTGKTDSGKVIVKYITKEGKNGKDGGDGYSIFLNNTSHTFEAGPVYATDAQTDFISVIALKGTELIPTHIGTIDGTLTGALTATIQNNDSSTASIRIDVNSLLEQNNGTLTIPVTVNTDGVTYMRDSSTGEPTTVDSSSGASIFDNSTYNTGTINLTYSWSLAKSAGDVRGYVLDLSNENASINCDSSGNILSGALRPTCTATLYYGVTPIVGATYELVIPDQSVTGVSIDNTTGELAFDNDFMFDGTSLELTVNGYDNDSYYWLLDSSTSTKEMIDVENASSAVVASSIMTITKNYPGADGSDAITYWLELNTNSVTVNPNALSPSATPNSVTAVAMKQVGECIPETATEASIRYDYNQTTATTAYSSPINVDISKTYLRVEMYVDNIWRDGETIPIMYEGLNGTSNYRLDLSNENASINCDSSGNILTEAVRPTCTANLYYGTTDVEGVTYAIRYSSNQSVQGVSINTSTGVITFNAGTASTPFSFTGTSLEITVEALLDSTIVALDIMTITKQYPGADGTPATTYFLKLSTDKVKVDPNDGSISPSTVSAEALKQVGEDDPVTATGAVIKYGFNTVSPTATYTDPVAIDASKDYLTFELYYDNVWRDEETIPILYEGLNGTNGTSNYRLDLSNENASINCDINGNILSSAVRPTCTANLFYGIEDVASVTYYISYSSSQSVQGVSIGSTSGVISFNAGSASTPFSFSDSALEITVSAYVNNTLCGTAIMTVSKSYPGEDGSDATSYWLDLSANEVKVGPNTSPVTVTPSTITATAYKQVGSNSPVSASDCTIKYGYNTDSPSTTYSSAITVDSTKEYITFKLYKGSVAVDTETVPIIYEGIDGANGLQGPQGRQGAAIRGPVNYYDQTSTRRFCSGELTDNEHPEDASWIDIIRKDSSLYYCTTSYTGSCADSWSDVSSNWTVGSEEYEFIATKLLLAENASIDFLSGNEIYLKDSNQNICAGAAGGSGVNFWAGDSTPGSAPFQVYNTGAFIATDASISGNINATSGTIQDVQTKRIRNPFTAITGDGSAIDIETGETRPIYSNIRTDDTLYSSTLNTHTVVSFAWDPTQSGRRITLAGSIESEAPSGYYFYENGTKYTKFRNTYEVVEFIGWGTDSQFFGWIVLSRTLFKTSYHYGRNVTPLCYGSITGTSSGSSFAFKRTFDGSQIYTSHSGTTGLYYLDVPKAWFYSSDYIFPEVFGKGYVYDSTTAPAKATVVSIGTTTHTIDDVSYDYYRLSVAVSDDSSRNNGSFYFRLYNMSQWDADDDWGVEY